MIVGHPPFVAENVMGVYQQIQSPNVLYPKVFGKDAKSLVKKLLVADLGQRYWNLKNKADDVKQHKWFKSIKWDDLLQKKIIAPFKPAVKGESDTSNFEDYPEDENELAPAVDPTNDPFGQL